MPNGPRVLGRAGGAEGGLDPPWQRGGECGVLRSESGPLLHPGVAPTVLLLAGGPGITGPSRWPRSRGHGALCQRRLRPWLSGTAEPQGHVEGLQAGSAAPGTALHIPSPCLPLAPTVPHATCTPGMCPPAPRGRQAATSIHPITATSPRTHPTACPWPPALPARPPAAGTSRLLFLALRRCALPAMAPYITIIAGCQRLEAGSQDRGGASTPLVTCHLVPAGLGSSTGYFRKSNLMGRRNTSHSFSS